MSAEAVARRYARAVFELAKDAGQVAEVSTQLAAFADAYSASDELRAIEHTPGLTESDREAVVKAIGERVGASDLVLRTLTMMIDRQRLAALPDMVRLVEAMADDHLGVLRASVTSAQPLSDMYRSHLKQKIEGATGKKVVMTFAEDTSLIAGIVTQVGDRIVDGSIRGKLNDLAASLRQ